MSTAKTHSSAADGDAIVAPTCEHDINGTLLDAGKSSEPGSAGMLPMRSQVNATLF